MVSIRDLGRWLPWPNRLARIGWDDRFGVGEDLRGGIAKVVVNVTVAGATV
jgi:hypothetical protein